MRRSAPARPGGVFENERGVDRTARRARLAARVKAINGAHRSTVPLRLVGDLPADLTESRIAHAAAEGATPHAAAHRFDVEVFDANDLGSGHGRCGELVMVIAPLVGDRGVQPADLALALTHAHRDGNPCPFRDALLGIEAHAHQ